jgi:hypothetical protein
MGPRCRACHCATPGAYLGAYPETWARRFYGRPAQQAIAVDASDLGELPEGERVEIRRLLLEAIKVNRAEPPGPSDQLAGEF